MEKHELPYIQDMFESIAYRYDFLNRTLSLRQDIIWRNKLVESLKNNKNAKILDIASGTGDVALSIQKKHASAKIFCVDFSINMLKLAQKKIKLNSNEKNYFMSCADAFFLPFQNQFFDAITMAFGIRNIINKESLLKSFFDHLKPGGQILILELTLPDINFLKKIYLLYFKKILPAIGQLISKNTFAYEYLPNSVMTFPSSSDFSKMIYKAGFTDVKYLSMTAGICTLFVGRRPL